MPISILAFDMDGTLFDSDNAYEMALHAVGLSLRDPLYLTARQIVKDRYPSPHTSARNRLLYFKELAVLKNNFSSSDILELMHAYEVELELQIKQQWEKLNRSRLFDELIKKYICIIVTNENTRTQLIKLRAIDPDGKYFKNIYTSEEIGVEKPDQSIFKWFLKDLQVQPRDVLFIGDSIENDIVPAQKLGFQTFLTTEFSASTTYPNTTSIAKLDKLLEILK